jgi:hypothetical protein
VGAVAGAEAAKVIGLNKNMRDTRLPRVLEALGAGDGGEGKYGLLKTSASGFNFLSVLEGSIAAYVVGKIKSNQIRE